MASFITSGYVQDGLKAVVYAVPLVYIVIRRKRLNLRFFWLFFAGLLLMFFGHLLDFLDEFAFLRRVFTSEEAHFLQDLFEDVVGMTAGFFVFMLGLYLEFVKKRDG